MFGTEKRSGPIYDLFDGEAGGIDPVKGVNPYTYKIMVSPVPLSRLDFARYRSVDTHHHWISIKIRLNWANRKGGYNCLPPEERACQAGKRGPLTLPVRWD